MNLLSTVLLQSCLLQLLWICYLLFYCSVVYRCCYLSVIYCSTAVLSIAGVMHLVSNWSTAVLSTVAVMNLLSTVLQQCCLLFLCIYYLLFYCSAVYHCCYESVIYCSTSVLSTVAVMNLLYSVLLQCCLLLLSTVLLLLVLWIFYVFGVFAKNERGYRLTAKNNRFWSLLILLLSVASIRRKLLKSTYTEEHSVHTNSESCNIWLVL